LLQDVAEPDTADLVILTDRRSGAGAVPLAIARGIVFSGAMWGMTPTLEAGDSGALVPGDVARRGLRLVELALPPSIPAPSPHSRDP
jgi:hypothetical protein